MNINIRKINLPTFLKIRIIIFLSSSLLLLTALFLNYHNYIYSLNRNYIVQGFLESLGALEKYKIIDTVFENLIIIIDCKLFLLLDSFLSTIYFILLIFFIHFFLNYIAVKVLYRKLVFCIRLFVIGMLSLVFCLQDRHLSVSVGVVLMSITLFVYIFDLYLFGNIKLLQISLLQRMLGILFIFAPVLSEVFCTPLFLDFIGLVRVCKIGRKSVFIIKCLHFLIIVFLVFTMTTPLESTYIKNATKIKEGEHFYGLAISQKASKLFFYSERQNTTQRLIECIGLNTGDKNSEIVYSGYFSEIIRINDERGELYVIDRVHSRLMILDINNYHIKGAVYSEGFAYGDCRIAVGNNVSYIVNGFPPFYIYKIDLLTPEIILQDYMNTHINYLCYNKKRNVLYTNECITFHTANHRNLFIYELDGQTLKILRKIRVPGGCWEIVISKDGNKLFCAFPFYSPFRSYVYVFDAKSLKLIDRIRVPLGTRAIAIDEERQLLFAGSAATNLIELIDLKNKNTKKIYKAGNHYLREISLDKERKTFFVSTRDFGLFKDHY